ncbi:MAG: hypothetical protein ACP5G2_05310 [Candidatus Bipolaricaulaceae bacterium]
MTRLTIALLACALPLAALGQVPFAPQAGPEAVLALVDQLSLPAELKAQLAAAAGAAMSQGRLTPGVGVAFLERMHALPSGQAEPALRVVVDALAGGFLVDPLLNEALKGLRLRRPWQEVVAVLRLRLALLEAARQVLAQQGVLPRAAPTMGGGGSAPVGDVLVLETAWAVGDFLLAEGTPDDGSGMAALLRQRLTSLRQTVLSPQEVDPLLAVLSPALAREIARLALDPERR